MTVMRTETPAGALERRIRGKIAERGSADWQGATLAFNTTVEQNPAFVAVPADADDVRAIVDVARENGLRIAPQRTGHNADPLTTGDGVVLLRTDALQGVEIDAERGTARVRAGAKWENLVPEASSLGLAGLHGSTPDVSIAGYALGGGVGWYGRKHGLATNSVTAIELVTADGELRQVDAAQEPELFWALRGGGGSFGVVTALELDLYPIPEVYGGVLFFPWERSAEVLHAWHAWTATVPDEVTSVGRILQFPPIPEVPEPLRGGRFAVVEAVVLGDEREGAELLEPLRALGPAMDTFALVPPVGISELHMDPPEPVPSTGDAQMLGELTDAALDAFLAAAGPGSGSPLLSVELRHVGGALGRQKPGNGALASLDAAFLTYGVGMVLDEDTYRANREALARVREALAPVDNGREYLNFTQYETDPARFYTRETYARLRAVKAAVDPDSLFRANHPIAPAS